MSFVPNDQHATRTFPSQLSAIVPNLTNFTITACYPAPDVDEFLRSTTFSKLESFGFAHLERLSENYEFRTLNPLAAFLQRHAPTLQNLSFWPCDIGDSTNEALKPKFAPLVLPKLNVLHTSASLSALLFQSADQCASLGTLKFNHCTHALSRTMNQSHCRSRPLCEFAFPNVHTLAMRACSCHPTWPNFPIGFPLLSQMFPKLHYLHLHLDGRPQYAKVRLLASACGLSPCSFNG